MPFKTSKKSAVAEEQAQAPVPHPPTWEHLPAMLRAGPRFVLWKYVLRDGDDDWTKPPYQTNGILASSTNPKTWATFARVVAAYKAGKWAGIGIALDADGLAGIDLDDCIDPGGKIEPWAQKIVNDFGSYTEVSPSGQGVRIFVQVEPGLKIGVKSGRREAYTHSRYLTLTGHTLAQGEDVAYRHLEFIAFAASIKSGKLNTSLPTSLLTGKIDPKSLDAEDYQLRALVIKKVNAAAQKFEGDQSRIDMCLAGMLLARVGNDCVRADRIARSTAYYRDKWDEPRGDTTWFGYTLTHAASGEQTQTEVQKLNGQYAVVSTGNRVNILQETVDPSSKEPTVSLLGVADFRLWLRNRLVGEKPLAEVWLSSPDRRQYDGVVFSPEVDTPGCYNLWRGFPVKPVPGDCSKFLQHVEKVICNGNAAVTDYVLNWCAHLVQRPAELPEVALVLRGLQGTGKGVFVRALTGLVGTAHSAHLTSMNQIVGRFNLHLAGKLLIFADEALWGGNRQSEGALKALITEPRIAIEAKNRDIVSVRNYARLVVASNATWAVPLDSDDRRFLVLDVSAAHKEDTNYFAAIAAELSNGGLAALMKFLRDRDLSKFSVRAMPTTGFGFDMKLKSASTVYQWWYGKLRDADPYHWQTTVEKHDLHTEYLEWCKAQHVQHPEMAELFSKELRKLEPKVTDYRPAKKVKWQVRTRMFKLPPLEQCRVSLQSNSKCGPEIWKD